MNKSADHSRRQRSDGEAAPPQPRAYVHVYVASLNYWLALFAVNTLRRSRSRCRVYDAIPTKMDVVMYLLLSTRWRRGVEVTSLGVSTKLLYVELG